MKKGTRAQVYAWAAMAALIFTNAASATNRDKDDNRRCETITVSETKSGPANYHETYGRISRTLVTIEDYKIRTEDGQVVFVDTDPQEVDLQDLSAFSKGLRMDLTNAEFPGGAQQIQAAEIEVNVRPANNRTESSDGTSCKFSVVPGKLNLYTSAPVTLGHAAYHVKVAFTALNGIQLHVLTKVTKTKCCGEQKDCDDDRDDHGHDHAPGHQNGHDHGRGRKIGHHKNRDRVCTESETQTSVRNQCKLVNRRHAITAIPLAVDDDF